MLIDYVTLGSNDLQRTQAFYDAVLAPLGHAAHYADDEWLSYGKPGEGAVLWIAHPFNKAAATAGNGTMVALRAPSRAAVDASHAAALALGAVEEGAPGLRPHYGPNFYVGYFRDPDGNKLAVVCRAAE